MPAIDRKNAVQYAAHERFARLVACIDGIVWEADAHTRQPVFVSPQAQQLLGGSADEWLRQETWLQHLHPDDLPLVNHAWSAAVEGGPRLDLEVRALRADGEVRFLHVVGEVQHDDAGRASRMVGIAQDVTEMRRAEREVRARLTRFRALVDHATDALFVHDADQRVLDANQQACDSLGYTLRELVGMSPEQFDAGYDLARLEAFDARMDVGEMLCFDTVHRRKDGSTFPVEVRVRRFLDDGHQRAVSIVRDITDRKRAEEALAAREAELRNLAEMSPSVVGMFHLRPDGRMCLPYTSPRMWDLIGLHSEDVAEDASPMLERTHPEDRAGYLVSIQESARTLTPWRHEFRVIHPTRGVRWLEGSTMPRALPDGGIVWYGFVHDITDRKEAEASLHRTEQQLLTLVESYPDFIVRFDREGRHLYASPSVARAFGTPLHEVVGKSVSDLGANGPPGQNEALVAAIRRAFDTGEPNSLEAAWSTPDGPRTFEVRHVPERDASGQVVSVLGITRDVTEQRRAEASLRLFRQLIDNVNDSIAVADPETGRILDVNERACQVHGYTREECLELSISDVAPGALPPDQAPEMIELRRSGHAVFESVHQRKDGSTFPVEVDATLIHLDRPYAIAMVRDITERNRMEQALRDSEARFRVLVEHASDAFFLQDTEGRVLDVNQRACESLGYSRDELIGMLPADFDADCSPDSLVELVTQLQRGEVVTFTSHHRRKDGSTVPVEVRCRSFREGDQAWAVSLARDITERTRLEEQLRHAQKMEAVGRLAGGVAHDFNNLLTAISGFSELVVGRMAPDDPNRDLMAEIRRAGDRAAGLTRQLLAFSRKQVLQPQVVSVNALLGDLLKLLRPLLGEDIDFALQTDPDIGLSRVDPGQFEQAVINLSVNARDAMPHGGRLGIETCNVELGADDVVGRPDVPPGRYVLVTVTDTGAGMDEATRAHMFEPFFTTKAPGKGTGLGLAMVYGFVKQSGGHVEVDSALGRGTAVRVYLPHTEELPADAASVRGPHEGARGNETILLVEDEDSVRALSRMVLRAKGYQVLEARDGREAIQVAQQHEGTIHLLVTDLVMPRLGGRGLAERLCQARPGLRVLFVSGYTADSEGAPNAPEIAFLQKPFSATELPRKVREVLDA